MYHHPLCHDRFRFLDCAVCTQGYGRSLSNICHYCDDTSANVVIAVSMIVSCLVLPLIMIAVVFLTRGFDTVNVVRQCVIDYLSLARAAIRNWGLVPETHLQE